MCDVVGEIVPHMCRAQKLVARGGSACRKRSVMLPAYSPCVGQQVGIVHLISDHNGALRFVTVFRCAGESALYCGCCCEERSI